jgi:cytochrome oxidase assembly protein ShyY1
MTALDSADRPPTALARDAVRLFREWVWLRSLLLVTAFAVLSVFLGQWQWQRHAEKSDAVHRVEANYTSPADPLDRLLPTPDAALPTSLEWHQTNATGSYLADRTVLIRNRPLNGVSGYEVLVPLRTASGALLLVDRGWLPSGRTSARPDVVPPPPPGPVEVIARLRPGEPPSDQTAPPGQAVRINIPAIAADLGAPTYQAYGVLAQETPVPVTAPQPPARPSLDLGNNLAYALQWWVFALGGFVLLGYVAFREATNRDLRARGLDPVRVRQIRSRRLSEDEDEDDAASA